jgi:urea carboxylase
MWKVGQIKPGDRIRFTPTTHEHATALEAAQELRVRTLSAVPLPILRVAPQDSQGPSAVLANRAAEWPRPKAVWRQAGDNCILLEYGEDILDLALRFRVHLLMEAIRAEELPVLELSPGVRSLQI